MPKSAFVSIVGRPSSGKSTLLNALCGHKVSIVSPVPQTTRTKVRGIVTDARGQLVFIDTPGIHDSTKKFNLQMAQIAKSALEETDVVLYVLDATRAPGVEENSVVTGLRSFRDRLVIAINKVDLPTADVATARAFATDGLGAAPIVETSALTGDGLDALRGALFEQSPDGELMYPEEFYTDQSPEFRVAELIREKAMLATRKEVPHSLYVDVSEMEVRKSRAGKTLWIRAFLMVERESQKGIVVGHGGEKIREIRMLAQAEIAGLFPYDSVHLDLRVKVNPKWRSNDNVLRKLAGS